MSASDQASATRERDTMRAQVVRTAMERFRVPGMAAGILFQGHEWLAGFGITNVNHPLPVTPKTRFQIGSITKTMTATALMRMVDRGAIDLDAPVRSYLPDLRLADEDVAERVRLRHLLTHTGGWLGDYFDDTGRGDDALRRIVERLVDLPQLTPLGETYSYSNSGFYLAGRVLEVVTGSVYETAARELVLEPLGMEESRFFPEEVMTVGFAVGHQAVSEAPRPVEPWAVARSANCVGGLISTVGDLLRYARFHLDDGSRPDGQPLLQPQSLTAMQTPQFRAAYPADHVGLAWRLRTLDGVRLVWHDGATKGQQATLLLAPEQNFALALLTNADTGGAAMLEIVNWALAMYLGVREPELTLLDTPVDLLAHYVGLYAAPLSDREVRLVDGELVLQILPRGGFPSKESPPGPTPPPVRLALWGPDRIVCLEDPMKGTRGEFVRDRDGQITALHLGGRLAPKVEGE